jgi:Mg2+/Co2+ transporter CorB
MVLVSSLIIAALLLFSACLSGTETAMVAASPGRMQKLKLEGNTKANVVLKLLKMKDKVISTILIMNTISNTVCTTVAAGLFIGLFGEEVGTLISSTVMSIFVITFAEVIPKAIAVVHAERIALHVSPYVKFTMAALFPLIFTLNVIVKMFCFIFRINLNPVVSATDELKGVIEHHHQEGNFFKNDKDMLGGILDLGSMTISEIMVHRSKVNTINTDLSVKEIVGEALATPHTRIPMWRNSKDNIVGILHIKDLLRILHANNFDYSKISVSQFMSEPWFILDHSLVSQQLNEFRNRRTHFALVIDEYGDLQGIVTLEDVIEEIVGQIDDEHDTLIKRIIVKNNNRYIIDAAISIRDLNREMNWVLPDEGASTLAGLIINEAKRLPEKGESFIISGLKMTIKKKHRNQLKSILVEMTEVGDSRE